MVSYSLIVGYQLGYMGVLILVVMEDGLVHNYERYKQRNLSVLILVVMEDGLVLTIMKDFKKVIKS